MNSEDLLWLLELLRMFRQTEGPGKSLDLACSHVVDALEVHPKVINALKEREGVSR